MSACYTVSKIDTVIVMFYKLQYTSIHFNHNKYVFYNTCFTIYCTIKNLISQCFDQRTCFARTPSYSWSPIKDNPEDFQVQDAASNFLQLKYADS